MPVAYRPLFLEPFLCRLFRDLVWRSGLLRSLQVVFDEGNLLLRTFSQVVEVAIVGRQRLFERNGVGPALQYGARRQRLLGANVGAFGCALAFLYRVWSL